MLNDKEVGVIHNVRTHGRGGGGAYGCAEGGLIQDCYIKIIDRNIRCNYYTVAMTTIQIFPFALIYAIRLQSRAAPPPFQPPSIREVEREGGACYAGSWFHYFY